MSTRITIPVVSTNAEDVTITAWRFEPGERVSKGDALLEVTTDKAAFEIEAPADGILLRIAAPARSVVPVGYIAGLLGEEGENDPDLESDNAALLETAGQALQAGATTAPSMEAPQDTSPTSARQPPASVSASELKVRATPKAKRLAAERGIDLTAVHAATGAAIITETVLNAFTDG